MIVRCPYCATSYQLDVARLTGPKPMLKCSRCRNTFPAPTAKKPATAAPLADKPKPVADGNLTLPFEEATWKDEAEPSPDLSVPEAEEDFTLGADEENEEPAVEEQSTPAANEPDETFFERPTAPEPVPPRRRRSPRPVREPESMDDDAADDGEDEAPASPDQSGRSGTTAILVFLAIVVAAYGVFARALFASPALCERLIGRVPLIGRLSDERLLIRKVALSEVAGSYQRIKDGKDVFVITGKALNTAPVALQGIQIVGKLYDGAGGLLDQKVIYCGNVVSAKVLKDLTPRELSILQKLSPPKRFMVEPGESSTFVIVFMDPPRQATEFSTQVQSAQRQA